MRKNVAYLCLLTVCLVGSLSAQTYQGRILGLVTDPTGAVLPGAQVTIIDVATGATRTLTTTTSGEFVAPNLEPGPYTVMVEAAGFQKFQRIGLQLEVARDIRVDAALHPGPVDTTVTISMTR